MIHLLVREDSSAAPVTVTPEVGTVTPEVGVVTPEVGTEPAAEPTVNARPPSPRTARGRSESPAESDAEPDCLKIVCERGRIILQVHRVTINWHSSTNECLGRLRFDGSNQKIAQNSSTVSACCSCPCMGLPMCGYEWQVS